MIKYNRNITELESNACKWWPDSLVQLEADSSIIPLLIQTQDIFISILKIAPSHNSESIFTAINAAEFSANLFLKHLMILTDFGSEPLQRINRDFKQYFPLGNLEYSLNGNVNCYVFQNLPIKGTLSNKKMHTDIEGIQKREVLTGIFKDLIVLLLFGGNSTDDSIAQIFNKCVVGNLLHQPNELENFIKQRYIHVSRITGGAQANNLGNAAQSYVISYLKRKLGDEYLIQSNGHIPGVKHNKKNETTFDLVISHNDKYVGIEISFQVTTNSTIERKAGQAQARYRAINNKGQSIAYIIDGAGNFQRENALRTICLYSHCTVAYTEKEFDILVEFIKERTNL